ncbi:MULTISPECIES: hypothetical protein [Streptomyces]|uniref:Thymidylate kinase n=1 Tax=Streptomyces chengmaiensis TaxID=3040919 RepID=A0ABT6HQ78_9ACTN|nr:MULTISPECIES: hypothetical protein [Streptomyces]MDH2390869.1 hypothetical protein [Streptomyces chengmaiensis]WRQ82306.1 hypothetical protein I3F59_024760 [Streptomyces sp. MUM 178J]
MRVPDFVSLNGPDNAGKTTHLRLLAAASGLQLLGSVHEHDPEPWARVAAGDYARWWFETSTTVELTEMLLAGHTKRGATREPDRTGLLDRGLPMLLAVAAATCAVKDGLTVREAVATVAGIAGSRSGPPETSVLLLPSLDAERSYAITSAREGRPWTGVYPVYQKTLHAVLLHQADHGTYTAVVDCENRSVDEVHADVRHHIAAYLPAPPLKDGSPR